MPNADGSLTPEEQRVATVLFERAQGYVADMTREAGPNAAAAVAILAGLRACEIDMGTEGLVRLLRGLLDDAVKRMHERSPGATTH